METETVPLIRVYRKDKQTFVEHSNDVTDYEAYGLLKSYVKSLENSLIDEWRKEK